MARITIILTLLTTVVALLGGFQWALNEWRLWRNKRSRITFLALLLIMGLPALSEAANHYVRASASGSADGSDWTNACTGFTGSCAVASLVRGDTYYVATGTYAALVFTTAESGTSVITVKGAIAADHGTNTGWLSSYGVDVTQATFGHGSHVQKSYYVFDGNAGSVLSSIPTQYGFAIAQPADCSTTNENFMQILNLPGTGTITNVTIKHVAIVACGSSYDRESRGLYVGQAANFPNASLVTISTCYIEQAGAGLTIDNGSDITVEYLYVNGNWTSVAHHGVTLQMRDSVSSVIRYNILVGARGTTTVGWYGAVATGHAMYGNVIDDAQGGNGVFASGDSASLSCLNCIVYHNTIVNSTASFFRQGNPSSSGNVLKNNLLWNSGTGIQGNGITNDYNSYLSAIDTPPTETNGQIATLDPFVSSAGDNFRLANDTSVLAGTILGSPYHLDLTGRVRGADGVVDRGAYEYALDSSPSGFRVAMRMVQLAEWALPVIGVAWHCRKAVLGGVMVIVGYMPTLYYASQQITDRSYTTITSATKAAATKVAVAYLRSQDKG